MKDQIETAAWRREMEMRIEALERENAEKTKLIAATKAWLLKSLLAALTFLAAYWAKTKGLF